MNLQKRDCPIRMKVSPSGYGWTELEFEIGNDKYEISVSGCLGSGIGGLIRSLYQLQRGDASKCDGDYVSETYEFVDEIRDGKVVGRRLRNNHESAWYEQPKATACDLDEEGHGYHLHFQRGPEEGNDFDVRLTITEWGNVSEADEKGVQYSTRYSDLCYALGKALTESVKTVGFGGFCENDWSTDVTVRHLCFLKAAGLGHPEWMLPEYEGKDSPCVTSFEDEMRLLNFDF